VGLLKKILVLLKTSKIILLNVYLKHRIKRKYSYPGSAYDKNTCLGIIYTTKEQESGIYIRYLNGTYVYAQQILNNDITHEIDNYAIRQLLDTSGTLDVLRAHYKIIKSN